MNYQFTRIFGCFIMLAVIIFTACEDELTEEKNAGFKIGYANEGGIYTMNPDGSDQQLVYDDENEATYFYDPAWSPDGTRVVFTEESAMKIYITNSDGTGFTELADGLNPSWSPDGTKIVYNYNDTIYTMNPDGSGQLPVYGDEDESSTYFYDPSWSPDGTRVVFVDDNTVDICIVDSDGSDFAILTEGTAMGVHPTWSPDGAKIIYDVDNSIWTMDPDGTDKSELIHGDGITGNYNNPSWSPDGETIAFVNEVDFNIYTARADGTGIVSTLNLGFGPTWIVGE